MNWPFSKKPALLDRLVDALVEERKVSADLATAHLETLQAVVKNSDSQAQLVREWFSSLASASKPEVRVMTDLDEYARDQARLADGPTPPASTFVPTIAPEQWSADLRADFAKLKSELLT